MFLGFLHHCSHSATVTHSQMLFDQTVPFLCVHQSTLAFLCSCFPCLRHSKLHHSCCADAADAADAATYVTPKETDYPEIKPKDKRLRDVAVTVVKTHLMLQQQSNLDLTPAEIAKGMSVILASDDPSPYVILATDVLRVWREKNPTLDPISMCISYR